MTAPSLSSMVPPVRRSLPVCFQTNQAPRLFPASDPMNHFSGVKALLFDFDGTLVDTMGAFADLAGQLMAEAYGGTVEQGREDYLRTSGIPFFQQLGVLHPADPRNDLVSIRFEKEKLSAYNSKGLFADVGPAVAELRRRGVACVVSSNNFTPVVVEFLKGQDVGFDLVLGYDSGFCKGEPHFAHVQRTLALSREQLGFVGDSVRDGELAINSGLRFCARLGTVPRQRFLERFGPNPFPFIDTLAELLSHVD